MSEPWEYVFNEISRALSRQDVFVPLSVREALAKDCIAELDAQGFVLLPPGGEERTQKVWPRFGESGTGTQKVIAWPDGSCFHGPVIPDPPPSPEVVEKVRERLRAMREGNR